MIIRWVGVNDVDNGGNGGGDLGLLTSLARL